MKGFEVVLVKDAHEAMDSDLTASQMINLHNRALGSWFAKLPAVNELQF